MTKGLFVNHTLEACSIHQAFKTFYQAQRDWDYIATDSLENLPEADFYCLNYHYAATLWSPASVAQLPGKKIGYCLETGQYEPFKLCPPVFDAYCIPDPTLETNEPAVYRFPRPLEVFTPPPEIEPYPAELPLVGTHGFASPYKPIELIANLMHTELGTSVFRIHLTAAPPYGHMSDGRIKSLRASLPPTVGLIANQGFLTKEEVFMWLGLNTLNVYFYTHDHEGLSSSVDDAIASGRPLLVNGCRTFRHIHKYIPHYPDIGLKEAIELGTGPIRQMQQDWAPERNREAFLAVLTDTL